MVRELKFLWIVPAFFFLTNTSLAGGLHTLGVRVSYTTTSKLFFSLDANDEALRDRFFSMDDVVGVGVELRRQFIDENLQFGVNVEYIQRIETGFGIVQVGGQQMKIPVKDGYRLIPVELTGFFTIPVSNEIFKFYMGGGVGFYFGKRIHSVVDVEAETIKRSVGFGIQVLSGLDFFLTPAFAIRGEMKFRDPQIELTSQFPVAEIQYQGTRIQLSQQPFKSKVNLDGISFSIGAAVSF